MPSVLDTAVLVVGCGVAAALSVSLTWGIWRTGAPTGADTAAHLVRTDDALGQLSNRGRLDGWKTSFGLGYQQFLFVGPGLTYAVGLLKLLSLGTLSNLVAFKLAVVLCYVALSLSVALGVAADAGLAGFVLVPLVAHRSLRGSNTGFAEEPTLQRLNGRRLGLAGSDRHPSHGRRPRRRGATPPPDSSSRRRSRDFGRPGRAPNLIVMQTPV